MAQPARATMRPTYIDLAEAAQILGITTRALRNWIADGRLPAYRLSAALIRVDEADVYALLRPIPTAGGHGV